MQSASNVTMRDQQRAYELDRGLRCHQRLVRLAGGEEARSLRQQLMRPSLIDHWNLAGTRSQ